MATIKKVKKYQNSGPAIKATKDSSAYYKKQRDLAAKEMASATSSPGLTIASNKIAKANKDLKRQKLKGKPGYDASGFPVKKQKSGGKTAKMKIGGTLAPSKKSVGKTFGKLNKAKYGSKTSKKK